MFENWLVRIHNLWSHWCMCVMLNKHPKTLSENRQALLYCLPNKCTLELVFIYTSRDHSYEENISDFCYIALYINCKQKNNTSSHKWESLVDVGGSALCYSVWVSVMCNLHQFFWLAFLWGAGKIKLMQIQTIESNAVPNHRHLLRIPM